MSDSLSGLIEIANQEYIDLYDSAMKAREKRLETSKEEYVAKIIGTVHKKGFSLLGIEFKKRIIFDRELALKLYKGEKPFSFPFEAPKEVRDSIRGSYYLEAAKKIRNTVSSDLKTDRLFVNPELIDSLLHWKHIND